MPHEYNWHYFLKKNTDFLIIVIEFDISFSRIAGILHSLQLFVLQLSEFEINFAIKKKRSKFGHFSEMFLVETQFTIKAVSI